MLGASARSFPPVKRRIKELLGVLVLSMCGAPAAAQTSARLDSMRELMQAERFEEAISYGDDLLRSIPGDETRSRAEASFNLASAHYFSQNEKEATRHGQEALRLASSAADTMLMLRSTRLLAELLFAANRYSDAIKMEREGIRLAQLKVDGEHLATFLSGVADNYLMMAELDSAGRYYRRTLQALQESDVQQLALTEANLAKVLSEQGDHAGAIAILEPSLARIKASGDGKYYKALNTLAYVYHKAGRHEQAVAGFTESERLNQAGDKDISTTLENLGFTAESLAALGDHARAYATMLQLEEQLHEYYARTANDEILALEKRFETQRKEQENALLRAENGTRRLNEERLRNRWIAAAAFATLLAGVLALLYRTYRARNQHARDMERVNGELERVNDLLRMRVLRAQLNPHFIHNCQNSAIALVKEGREQEALSYLQGLSKLMRAVLDHSVKDRINLEEEVDFLRQYLALEALRLQDLRYEVDAEDELLRDETLLPALLVQPFVENAIWHGLASKQGDREVLVHFTATNKGLRCTVTDNGVGRQSAVGRAGTERSYATELTQERLLLLTHRMQQRSSIAITDRHDDAGRAVGTEVVIDLAL